MSDKNLHLTYHGQDDNGHDDVVDTPDVSDTYDRPASAHTAGTYARAGSYDEAGNKIPKTGVYAAAGVGKARAEYSVFEAEAKGPNASAGAKVTGIGAGAMARAEIASASAKAGPVGVKVGLGFDTGLSAGLDGVEAKVLGTGFTIDEEYDILSDKQQQKGKPSVKPTSGDADIVDSTNINDMYDRPGSSYTEGKFARDEKYVEVHEDEAGKRIPKTGVCAPAGVRQACVEYSVFKAEAKGPNASAGAEASQVGVGVMARAKAGPLGVKVGLGLDTGESAGVDGLEAKVLGTGFSIGPKTSVSVLGNEASCSVM